MYEDIENRVTEMVGKYAKQEGLTRNMHLMDDLGLDALDIVEVIMAAETEFDVCISEESADRVRTVGDVVDAVIKAKVSDPTLNGLGLRVKETLSPR